MADNTASKIPTINFDSPKAAPVVLSIGALLWRILAWWENIDFILSVREERVAVALQLILDWGWLFLIIAGVVWFLGANRAPVDTSKVHWGMVTAVGILSFMTGSLISVYATGSLPNILMSWGGDPAAKTCSSIIDTSRLVGVEDKYHVILICGMADPTTDPLEDTRIAVSKPFTVNGQAISVVAPYGALMNAAGSVGQNQAFALWHSVVLLPKDIDTSEIKRVSDVGKRGGRIIVQPPAGGFSNGMPGLGPQIPAPSPAPSTAITPPK
jgi:hypothetical protein